MTATCAPSYPVVTSTLPWRGRALRTARERCGDTTDTGSSHITSHSRLPRRTQLLTISTRDKSCYTAVDVVVSIVIFVNIYQTTFILQVKMMLPRL